MSEWAEAGACPPPKDGSRFIALNMQQGGCAMVTWWSKAHQTWYRTGRQPVFHFTHWLPLPPLPTEGH